MSNIDINSEFNTGDGRKYISLIRKDGFPIKDFRVGLRKYYYFDDSIVNVRERKPGEYVSTCVGLGEFRRKYNDNQINV